MKGLSYCLKQTTTSSILLLLNWMICLTLTAVVIDEDISNYVTLIVPTAHPLLSDILSTFDNEISMFQNNK